MMKESNPSIIVHLGYAHLKLHHAFLPFLPIMHLLILLQIPECADTIKTNQFQVAAPFSNVAVIVVSDSPEF